MIIESENNLHWKGPPSEEKTPTQSMDQSIVESTYHFVFIFLVIESTQKNYWSR